MPERPTYAKAILDDSLAGELPYFTNEDDISELTILQGNPNSYSRTQNTCVLHLLPQHRPAPGHRHAAAEGVLPDWRAILNVVLIDGAYDGEVFNITLSDVPERKDDLVAGRNEFPHQANYVTFQFFSLDL